VLTSTQACDSHGLGFRPSNIPDLTCGLATGLGAGSQRSSCTGSQLLHILSTRKFKLHSGFTSSGLQLEPNAAFAILGPNHTSWVSNTTEHYSPCDLVVLSRDLRGAVTASGLPAVCTVVLAA
jgi:hypothetical protein